MLVLVSTIYTTPMGLGFHEVHICGSICGSARGDGEERDSDVPAARICGSARSDGEERESDVPAAQKRPNAGWGG